MELWYPPTDRPHLLEWWRPLLQLSRAARAERSVWAIHVDDFSLRGRVDRGERPSIWIYRHGESQGELYVDATGQPYRFIPTPRAKGPGRFQAIEITRAIWGAGIPHTQIGRGEQLPDVDWDEPVDEPVQPADAGPAPRRRGHLTVYDGGRAAG